MVTMPEMVNKVIVMVKLGFPGNSIQLISVGPLKLKMFLKMYRPSRRPALKKIQVALMMLNVINVCQQVSNWHFLIPSNAWIFFW